MAKKKEILLLTDSPGGGVASDLNILYPGRVECLDFTARRHSVRVLAPYACVVTLVTQGANLRRLDFGAVAAYARNGGQVVACLFEYAAHRGRQFSKTHVLDRLRPALRIEVEGDVTRGYAVGDEVWWYGTVSSAADVLYDNQMYQRQVMDLQTSGDVTVLATSTVNGGAVIVEERVGKGRIVAMDLLSPGRPWYNSKGSTNKYLFLGNVLGRGVRYGRHYRRRLPYEEFVQAMAGLAAQHPELSMQEEGPCSDGRSMWSYSLGDPAHPTVYLGAAIHGWEWENAFGLLRFAELLCREPKLERLDTRRLHYRIVPVQNPWGYDHFTRQNARGVDLNRNFDCHWRELATEQDVAQPWDYNCKGSEPASEPETRVIQGLIDRERPLCVIDFHTADYFLLRAHRGDRPLLDAIHGDIRRRLKDRFLTQKPFGGPYQQVNVDRAMDTDPVQPYLICYAAEQGTPAAFVLEMSGNRDDVHALVMNTDTVVGICLAAVKHCLRVPAAGGRPLTP